MPPLFSWKHLEQTPAPAGGRTMGHWTKGSALLITPSLTSSGSAGQMSLQTLTLPSC